MTNCASGPSGDMYTALHVPYNPESKSPPPLYEAYDPGGTPPQRDSFGPGEIPAIYIKGYGGETIKFEIKDLLTGNIVYRRTEYIPKNKKTWGYTSFPFLVHDGSYIVYLYIIRLKVYAEAVGSWSFSVKKGAVPY